MSSRSGSSNEPASATPAVGQSAARRSGSLQSAAGAIGTRASHPRPRPLSTGGSHPPLRPLTGAALFAWRARQRDLTVATIGLGYAGLPMLLRLAEAGFPALGFDVDARKVETLARGESYLSHIPSARIRALVETERLETTGDPLRLAEADAILICVPTPITAHREPDLSYVEATADTLSTVVRPGQLVSLESTTWPGTTEEVLLPRLAASGLEVGRELFVTYSPEREDPGNAQWVTADIPRLVGGVTPQCRKAACALYAQVVRRIVPCSSTRVAESAKVLENVYRGVNIALVNEMKLILDRLDVDVWEVIRAAATKPFGFQPFAPGPGVGGHCIPVDPFYLAWKAKEHGLTTHFIELAGEINRSMPRHVVERLARELNARGKPLKGSRVLVLGLAYKKDVADPRESPAVDVLELLLEAEAEVAYSDPFFPELPPMRRGPPAMRSVALAPDALRRFDAAVLVTDHSTFPYRMIAQHVPLVVDTRDAFRARGVQNANVVRA